MKNKISTKILKNLFKVNKRLFAMLMLTPLLGIAQQSPSYVQDSLNINGVNTSIGPGSMFWNLSNTKYEVPQGSGIHSIFAHDLWIGGVDNGGQLRLAAQTYRQGGSDYWPGPISDSIYQNDINMADWNRVWKVNKAEIDNHIINYSNGSYIIPEAIENWPAHGDVSMGQAPNLAPFIDVDNNGMYNPLNGDYPDILGDQAVYIIKNDVGGIHTESNGEQIGLEIHMMFYGYRCDNSPELNHTVFVKTTLFNRGTHNINNSYIGTWADMDLGNYIDDYVGCNIDLNLGYTYNGDNNDEGAQGYGINPPVQGIVYLNNTMDKFIYYNNIQGVLNGNPNSAQGYYNYLQGIWLNNTPMTYGGDGYGGGVGATTDTCNYMFTNNTDPNFTTPWTEVTAGNVPSDRRFVMSNGPFDLGINTSHTLEYAFVFAWDSTNANGGSLPLLFNYTQNIQDFYNGNLTYSCVNINAINEQSSTTLNKGKLLKTIDVLGRETEEKSNTPLFYIYENGVVEKRLIVE